MRIIGGAVLPGRAAQRALWPPCRGDCSEGGHIPWCRRPVRRQRRSARRWPARWNLAVRFELSRVSHHCSDIRLRQLSGDDDAPVAGVL